MIADLQSQLRAAATRHRFIKLATGAPSGTPLSIAIDLPDTPNRDWIQAWQPGNRPFWFHARPREGRILCGLGHAFLLDSEGAQRFATLDHAWQTLCHVWRHEIGTPRPQAFCGFAFCPERNNGWPNARLGIPTLLIEQHGVRLRAIITLASGNIEAGLSSAAELLLPASHGQARQPRRVLRIRDPAEENAWLARTSHALSDIERGLLAKLVLCREIRLRQDQPIAPMRLLETLCAQQSDATIYAHSTGHETFLGATPESLLRFSARQIETMALAGTAWQGSPPLASDKNRHEQSLVTEAILGTLAPLITGLELSRPETATAGMLTHWRTRISGQPRPNVRCLTVLDALHPTPAVGGFPSRPAQAWLRQHEPARTAWYSGGFGLLGSDGSADFSVALRSALIRDEQAYLQAGAGIVAGSVPAQELAETDAKFGTQLRALGCAFETRCDHAAGEESA
jgi:isochorismate synthase